MFTVQFRVNEPLVCGNKHLTREWQSLGHASSQKDAEVTAAWLIHEIQEFAASAGKTRALEYQIVSDSSGIVVSNKV